jgi:hypothetical protein
MPLDLINLKVYTILATLAEGTDGYENLMNFLLTFLIIHIFQYYYCVFTPVDVSHFHRIPSMKFSDLPTPRLL